MRQFVSFHPAKRNEVLVNSCEQTAVLHGNRKRSPPNGLLLSFPPLLLSSFYTYTHIHSFFFAFFFAQQHFFTIYCKHLNTIHPSLNLLFVIPDKSAHTWLHSVFYPLRHRCCAFLSFLPYESIVGNKLHHPFSRSIRDSPRKIPHRIIPICHHDQLFVVAAPKQGTLSK